MTINELGRRNSRNLMRPDLGRKPGRLFTAAAVLVLVLVLSVFVIQGPGNDFEMLGVMGKPSAWSVGFLFLTLLFALLATIAFVTRQAGGFVSRWASCFLLIVDRDAVFRLVGMDWDPHMELLNVWRAHRQGLDGSLAGASPYLTLFSRAGIGRESADDAARRCEIHELPAVRNCTYVLPQSDFALGLRAGQSSWVGGDLRTALKLGVTEKEIAKLCDAVGKAVGKVPLGPDAIRGAVGSAARSLGEEGKKKGVSTTLHGRLDRQRYLYVAWGISIPQWSVEEVAVELARRHFRWIGPATLAEFQWFSGLSAKVSKAAVAALGLVKYGDGKWRVR